ncbi:Flp pilus assembly protein CpaB [bacterium F11]|nr:Flp pilus assembly protein CpaB [bacterium F11]
MSAKMRLLISIILGLITMALFYRTLQKKDQELKKHVTATTVLRAKRYIKMGKSLTPHEVEVVSVPEAFLEPTALQTKADILNPSKIPRFKARIGFLKGEQITRSKLLDEGTQLGLAWILEPHQTAITLRFKPDEAVGGWIQPGDWVYLFSSIEKQEDWPKFKTHLLFNPIRILAVDKDIWDPMAPLGTTKMNRPMTTEDMWVTMSLAPQQAAMATLADQKGALRLGLVSPLAKEALHSISVGLRTLQR